jgi:hypothetical protein
MISMIRRSDNLDPMIRRSRQSDDLDDPTISIRQSRSDDLDLTMSHSRLSFSSRLSARAPSRLSSRLLKEGRKEDQTSSSRCSASLLFLLAAIFLVSPPLSLTVSHNFLTIF